MFQNDQTISGNCKSTLVRHFVETLEKEDPEIVVLAGRCYEQESVPYKAFDSLVDVLSSYLSRLPILEVESVIPRDIQALARLFPVLRQVEAVVRARWQTLDGIDLQELRCRGFSALPEMLKDHHHGLALALELSKHHLKSVDRTFVCS